MIYLPDYQPLSLAKINIFSYISKRGFSDEVHTILIEDHVAWRRQFRRFTSLLELKYLHQPSYFVLDILTLCCNV